MHYQELQRKCFIAVLNHSPPSPNVDMPYTPEERLAFVNNRSLNVVSAAAAGELRIATENSQDTADVVAGSALYFPSDVPGQFKSDIINSTLFAQLAADSKYDRWDDAVNWYNDYKAVLDMLGWDTHNFQMIEIGDVGHYGSMARVVSQLSASFLSGEQLGQLSSMINALKETRNEAAENTFNNQSRRLNAANFQIGVVRILDGNRTMAIQQYVELSSQEIDRVLFDAFGDAKVKLQGGNQTMLLNEQIYAQIREAVLAKLSNHPLNVLIRPIEL
ncbi:hypothetical protein C8Q73DRAFT_7526 [Cubamyces lactineus]|nr:hypothetical protein C8Q73DRAFT_7526 [Cubamyces lactineus]